MDSEEPIDPEGERRIGWRHWYHITLGTYGHWLRGDPRRWSERHHRKHVPHKEGGWVWSYRDGAGM